MYKSKKGKGPVRKVVLTKEQTNTVGRKAKLDRNVVKERTVIVKDEQIE